jgi:hypothetical protein
MGDQADRRIQAEPRYRWVPRPAAVDCSESLDAVSAVTADVKFHLVLLKDHTFDYAITSQVRDDWTDGSSHIFSKPFRLFSPV